LENPDIANIFYNIILYHKLQNLFWSIKLLYFKTGLSGIPNSILINNFIYMKNFSRKSIRARMGPY